MLSELNKETLIRTVQRIIEMEPEMVGRIAEFGVPTFVDVVLRNAIRMRERGRSSIPVEQIQGFITDLEANRPEAEEIIAGIAGLRA